MSDGMPDSFENPLAADVPGRHRNHYIAVRTGASRASWRPNSDLTS